MKTQKPILSSIFYFPATKSLSCFVHLGLLVRYRYPFLYPEPQTYVTLNSFCCEVDKIGAADIFSSCEFSFDCGLTCWETHIVLIQ